MGCNLQCLTPLVYRFPVYEASARDKLPGLASLRLSAAVSAAKWSLLGTLVTGASALWASYRVRFHVLGETLAFRCRPRETFCGCMQGLPLDIVKTGFLTLALGASSRTRNVHDISLMCQLHEVQTKQGWQAQARVVGGGLRLSRWIGSVEVGQLGGND